MQAHVYIMTFECSLDSYCGPSVKQYHRIPTRYMYNFFFLKLHEYICNVKKKKEKNLN